MTNYEQSLILIPLYAFRGREYEIFKWNIKKIHLLHCLFCYYQHNFNCL